MGRILVLLLLSIISTAYSDGYYNAVGSRVIRPNSEYHCAVTVQATSEVTTVIVSLQGSSFNGSSYNTRDEIVVQPYSTRVARLQVGDIEDGNYNLQIRGSGGVDFQNSFPLDFLKKSYSVFIQTDRAVYNPGSKILFRAIVLNSQLKPAAEVRNEHLNIFVTDGDGNKVKQWTSVEATRGVFTGDLKLSKSPVLGNWNISVTIHGQTFHKSIDVAEYILPKFIVDVEAPKHITFKENILNINIRTRYDYGKKVKGEATVSVYPTIYSGVIQPIFQNPIRKVIPVDGFSSVEFDIEKELRLNDEYERTVIVDVTVEEIPTGRRQNNSVEVHLHKYDYKIDLIKSADYFKPGLKYMAYVRVSRHDGVPLKPDEREITVRHGYSRTDEVYVVEKHQLDKNGIVKLQYYTPRNASNTTALRIEAEYKDLKERISPIPAAVSFSNTFLVVSLETEKPIINLDIEVFVNCTEPMRYVNYVLMGRGDVVIANSFQVDNSKEFQFHFTATHAMVPVAHLFVSYVRPDGELVGDSIDIEVNGLFQNFVDIQVNTLESEPELDVDLIVNTRPNSYIGLLAVDENVNRLRSGYDISKRQVIDELLMYDGAMKNPYSLVTKDLNTYFPWKPGSSHPHSAVYDSGADLITNAHIKLVKPTLEDIYLRPVFYGASTVKPDRGFALPVLSVTRPPLAGPYAFSRIPRPVWNKPKVYLSQDILDTWLFTNFSSGYEGKTSVRRRIPPGLGNWLITGFSLDPLHGLGVITSPKKLKVSKTFVVTLDLPYSIRRGEILAVPVVVRNYMDRDINAEVTLHNPDQKFEFSEVSNEINATKKVELYRRKRLTVKKFSGASVSFMIRPHQQGSIEIKATASGPKNQDVVIKNLLVKPEGETEYYTKTLLVDLRKNINFKGNINFTIPKSVVAGSEKIQVSAVADFLGPTMIHLENLIRLPSACGEQNLVHLMPNVIILQYLRNTRQINLAIENEAIVLLETSYQQQLSYKRSDGSFSAFGTRDDNGSVWLTAYVILALHQAKSFIYVDQDTIDRGLSWLVNIQGQNGSFVETGTVIHSGIQNKDGNSLALTAFTVMALIENRRSSVLVTNAVNKGLDYIARNMDEDESAHTLALCSYVLQIAKHTSKLSAFNLLDSKAKSKGDMKWWSENIPPSESKNPWNELPRTPDVETTSYALLTFLEANLLDDALPIVNWLVNQQNNLGGFTSSQDTVIGLIGLYKLVMKMSSTTNMQIEFTTRKQETNTFRINKNNAMILQTLEVDKKTRQVNVTAQGTGLVLFRVSYQYNMNVTGPWPMFTLDPQVDKNSNKYHIQISICTAFVSRNLSDSEASNMAVMEVNLPSGFTVDVDSLPSLEVSQNVQKVESQSGLTKVVLYFNNLTRTEYCPTVSAFSTHKVAKLRPGYVVIYDYYDSSRRARIFYKGPNSTLCDICEDEDCGNICSTSDPYIADGSTKKNHAPSTLRTVSVPNFLFVCVYLLLHTNNIV